MPKMQKEFNRLPAKDKLFFIDKLLRYTLPTLQSVDAKVDIDYDKISDDQLLRVLEQTMNL